MHPSISKLITALGERFGPAVFPIEHCRSDRPEAVGFTTAKDKRVYLSVVVTGQCPERYSLMIEVMRADDAEFPFTIAEDQSDLTLQDLLEIFSRHQ